MFSLIILNEMFCFLSLFVPTVINQPNCSKKLLYNSKEYKYKQIKNIAGGKKLLAS